MRAVRGWVLLAPIWIGLGSMVIGVLLLTLFGLIWPQSNSTVGLWGFRAGVLLTLAGSALAIVFS